MSRVSCQGVRVFSGGGGLNFFLEVVQLFLGGKNRGYIIKLAISHDKVLPCVVSAILC